MFIELGELKIQLLILLVYPAGIISARLNNYYFTSNPYFFLFIFFISHYLVLFIKLFYIIKDHCTKIKNGINKNQTKDDLMYPRESDVGQFFVGNKKSCIDLIKLQNEKKIRREKIISMIFVGILYFISYVFFYYSNFITTTTFYGNISMITEMLYFSLFNRIIFGNKIYYHHLFSMILISLCILGLYILLIIKFIGIDTNGLDVLRDIIYPTILNFVVYLLFCYQLVKAKYYIEKYFISLYQIMFALGSIGLILLLIFEPITFFIPCDNIIICSEGHFAGFISGFKQFSTTMEYINTVIAIFLLFLTAFGLWLTVIYLTPSHFLTSDSIITLGINIIIDCFSENLVLLNNPLFYIMSLLTIFGCLIYNEIIILNVFGLNHNTRKQILSRQRTETTENFIELRDSRTSDLGIKSIEENDD